MFPGFFLSPAQGLTWPAGRGRRRSWPAWPAQASTGYHRPWWSRRQPEETGGSGQFGGAAVTVDVHEAMAAAPLG
jgi:hypothetical protein